MYVYCTSKNTGPWTSDPVHLLYVGTSVKEAEEAVGRFTKYAKSEEDFFKTFPELYSALPHAMDRELIQFFMADGWWYSIERFELTEQKSVGPKSWVTYYCGGGPVSKERVTHHLTKACQPGTEVTIHMHAKDQECVDLCETFNV